MSFAKVSPKYQIVIPKEVREYLKIEPGQELYFSIDLEERNSVTLIPVRPIEELQKELRGLDIKFEREKVDRDPTGKYSYAEMVARAKRRKAS